MRNDIFGQSPFTAPAGMSRRHFFKHLATSAAALPAMQFVSHLRAHAAEVKKNQKACILMWLSGGPPTIDMWDPKPNSKEGHGGEFKPISTRGGFQISEHLPKSALLMKDLSIVRSMSTREADHGRGRYYLHTAYVPNPTVVHPTFGSVVAYELGPQRKELAIPPFVAIGGPGGSAGFLGMANAPFVVGTDGRIRNAEQERIATDRLEPRLEMLSVIESEFMKSDRGKLPQAHKDVYAKAVSLMTSQQMSAFKVMDEPAEMQEAYGRNGFGQGLLMARRLVEGGVPFVEVDFGGWDLHQDVFNALRTRMLPTLDQGLSALVTDLKQRGMLDHVVIVCMGEFGRTPRINQSVGRDHWARSWSVVLGGGGLKGGMTVGATDDEGVEVVGKGYLPGDVWATVSKALGIPLDTTYTSDLGRPMKIANGGTAISELFA